MTLGPPPSSLHDALRENAAVRAENAALRAEVSLLREELGVLQALVAAWQEALLAEAERMFGWWKRVKAGELSRRSFQVSMRGLRARVEGLLEEGTRCAPKKTARTCQKLLAIRAALWTFVTHEGVEPTKNAAEQVLRFAVLWRTMSYGTHSMPGRRFVERLLTTSRTLRRQKRSVIGFLREAWCAHRAGRSPPSLLPS